VHWVRLAELLSIGTLKRTDELLSIGTVNRTGHLAHFRGPTQYRREHKGEHRRIHLQGGRLAASRLADLTPRKRKKHEDTSGETPPGKRSQKQVTGLIWDKDTRAGGIARRLLGHGVTEENLRYLAQVVADTFHGSPVTWDAYMADVERAINILGQEVPDGDETEAG
jgi:hypothetical protein